MSNEREWTFLVVDSDLTTLETSARLLEEMGHQRVLQSEDGAEGWAMIKGFQIDVVICDQDIAEVSPLALLRLIRSNENLASLSFILTAGEPTAKMVSQYGRLGVSDILVRPYAPDTFRKKILANLEFEEDPKIKEAELAYQQGLELMNAGRHEEALQTFEKLVNDKEHAEVYYNMGYIMSGRGRLNEAIGFFRRATWINKNFVRAYKLMGEAFLKLGKEQPARLCFQRAADIYLDRNQDNEAEEVYEAVIKLKPDTTNVYNSLGIIYRRQGRLTEAVEQYRKALLVDNRDENIHFNLARVYIALKDIPAAAEAVRQALELNPDFASARDLNRTLEMGLLLTG